MISLSYAPSPVFSPLLTDAIKTKRWIKGDRGEKEKRKENIEKEERERKKNEAGIEHRWQREAIEVSTAVTSFLQQAGSLYFSLPRRYSPLGERDEPLSYRRLSPDGPRRQAKDIEFIPTRDLMQDVADRSLRVKCLLQEEYFTENISRPRRNW